MRQFVGVDAAAPEQRVLQADDGRVAHDALVAALMRSASACDPPCGVRLWMVRLRIVRLLALSTPNSARPFVLGLGCCCWSRR